MQYRWELLRKEGYSLGDTENIDDGLNTRPRSRVQNVNNMENQVVSSSLPMDFPPSPSSGLTAQETAHRMGENLCQLFIQ
jgi:hypothetical protein